jgi:SAM-dependent methyltransferase
VGAPSPWLLANADLLPRGGRVLDVACGRGRHALWLAAAGFDVHAVDRARDALDALRKAARRAGTPLEASELDLEAETVDLGESAYDAIIVFRVLHRPLFPALARALREGGVLVYETFTVGQEARGHPHNPRFHLQPGELVRLAEPLEVIRQRVGDFEGQMLASIVARKRGPGV